jgi:cell division protease FtsH
LIETQYVRALEVLTANKEGHEKLAELLLEKEVIFSEDLENVFGKRKWGKPLMVAEVKKEIAAGLLENNEAPAETESTTT